MDLLIGNVFRSASRSTPGRVAATMGERTLRYGELEKLAIRQAHALRGLGVQHRDRVVMWSDTSLDAVPLFVAVAKLGAVFAPANARLSVGEATEMVGMAKPRLLAVDLAHAEEGEEVAKAIGVPLVRLGEGRGPGHSLTELANDASDSDISEPNLVERDTHVLFFTSGSTGRSKGVILSHRVNFLRTHPGGLLEPRGTTVCMYPLFHMGAWTLALQAWQARSKVTFLESPTAENVAGAVERERAERLNCIPAVWQRILDEGDGRWDLSSLRLVDSGTSATPPELLAAIAAAVPGAKLRVFYGSTESGGVTILEHDDVSRKPGSCGLPHPGVEIRLTDIGEICVRSPVLFDGYFDAPEATSAALANGWYQTGDLGMFDDEGFLSIIGRAKDTIRTGGETVSPSEVEGILASFPGLSDIAIVGIPDPRWGEVVCAVAVPTEGSEPPTLDALQVYCEGRLARFKVPRRLEFVDSVPRTPATNQVKRRVLIERFSSGSTA